MNMLLCKQNSTFTLSQRLQVPMPPVYGSSWAWEKQPLPSQSVQQCTNCTVEASGQHICSSCTGGQGAGGRR